MPSQVLAKTDLSRLTTSINRRDFVSNAAGGLASWAAGITFAKAADADAAPTVVLINESYLRRKYPNDASALLAKAKAFAERHGGALVDVGRYTTARAIKAELARSPRPPTRLVLFGEEDGIPRFPVKAPGVDIQIDSPYGDLDGDGLTEIAVSRVLGSPQAMMRQLGASVPFGPSPHAIYLGDHDPRYRTESNRFMALIGERGCTLDTHGPGNPRLLSQAELIVLGAHGNPNGWYPELGRPFVTDTTVPDLPRHPVAYAGACSTATPGAPILRSFLEKGCRAYIGAVSDSFGWTSGDKGNELFMHFIDALGANPDWTVAKLVAEARNRYVRAKNLQALVLKLEKGESPNVDEEVTHTALQWQMFGDVTAQFPRTSPHPGYRKFALAAQPRALKSGDVIPVRYDVGAGDGVPLLWFQAAWDNAVSARLQIEVLQNGASLQKIDWREQREWWAYPDTSVGGYLDRGRYYAFAVVPLVRREGSNDVIVRVSQASRPIEVLTGSTLQVWPQRPAPGPIRQHERRDGINLLWLAREGDGIVPRLTRGDTGPLRGALSMIGGLAFDRRDDFGSMLAPYEYPERSDLLLDLTRYDVIIVDDMWNGYRRIPRGVGNRVRDFVQRGGGLIMAGGRWSFAGMNAYKGDGGQGGYAGTPIGEILPVRISGDEDCVEEKTTVRVVNARHPVAEGLDWGSFPPIHGYNRVTAKPGAEVLARTEAGDPFIAVWKFGNGFVATVMTRSGGDWGADFKQWRDYRRLWRNIVRWVSPVPDRPMDFSGIWRANDNGIYTVKQSGSAISWEAVSGPGGRQWRHKFQGMLQGDRVSGRWIADAPDTGRGDLALLVAHNGRLDKVPGTGAGFGGSLWVRDLSGVWHADDGGIYTVAHSGLKVDWKAASGDGGRSWTHNFNGTLRGDVIVGQWAANPPGGGRGDLSVYVVDSRRFDKVPETGGGFGGGVWTRA